jgi:hypothetical protein
MKTTSKSSKTSHTPKASGQAGGIAPATITTAAAGFVPGTSHGAAPAVEPAVSASADAADVLPHQAPTARTAFAAPAATAARAAPTGTQQAAPTGTQRAASTGTQQVAPTGTQQQAAPSSGSPGTPGAAPQKAARPSGGMLPWLEHVGVRASTPQVWGVVVTLCCCPAVLRCCVHAAVPSREQHSCFASSTAPPPRVPQLEYLALHRTCSAYGQDTSRQWHLSVWQKRQLP